MAVKKRKDGKIYNKGGLGTGVFRAIAEYMSKKPEHLYTPQQIFDAGFVTTNPANTLWYLWRHNKIMRHKDRNADGKYQYAFNIPNPDDRAIFGIDNPHRLAQKIRFNGEEILTPAEIRATITPIIRQIEKLGEMLPSLVQLEMTALKAVEAAAEATKQLDKAKAFFGKDN